MPQVEISIGGRVFEVACRDGEERFLQAAAQMLDTEAQHLTAQMGRVPEARMLLMAGLMLADKAANLEEKLAGLEAELTDLQTRAAKTTAPEKIEVPVIPDSVTETLAQLATRAEALAKKVEAG